MDGMTTATDIARMQSFTEDSSNKISENQVSDEYTSEELTETEECIKKARIFKKRMGRPFCGGVSDSTGKEDNVVIKRSIFRLVRKIYGRDGLETALGPQALERFNQLNRTQKKEV